MEQKWRRNVIAELLHRYACVIKSDGFTADRNPADIGLCFQVAGLRETQIGVAGKIKNPVSALTRAPAQR